MAIAFDAATDGLTNSTYSHTCTGTNRLIVVYVRGALTDTGASVTYNGVSMTQINKVQIPGDRWQYLFYLANPASGANNVVITGTVNRTCAASYTGVKQSGSLDNNVTDTATSVTSRTTSITTVADNCWLVGLFSCVGGGTMSAGTNTTIRVNSTNSLLCDSNSAQTPAGSHSLAINVTTTDSFGNIVASFAPATTPVNSNFLAFI